MNHASLLVLAASGVLASLPAAADTDTDLKALRAEIVQLKETYEHRIEALEKRLKTFEPTSTRLTHADRTVPPSVQVRTEEGKANAFNPAIGLVLQGQVKSMKDVPERMVSGYWPAAGHNHSAEKRGASLEHAELIVSANIDPDFRGVARMAVSGDGEVEVEEASISTLGLGNGFTIRAGRFASDIGYQNAQHRHEWDFADATLMQKVLFGNEGYREDGVQVKWLAPTPFMLQFGAEFGRGANFPGTDRNKNGSGTGAVFVKTGGDVGVSSAWQAGVSFLNTKAVGRETHVEDIASNQVQGYFSGKSRSAIADFVWKWAPNGNASSQSLKLQGEVFRRTESGELSCNDDLAVSATCIGNSLGTLKSKQTGGYISAVYQFMPKWRVGFRYDRLEKGAKSFDGLTVFAALDLANHYFADFKPRRESVMVDWSNSEFSRLRLQFARDRAMMGISDNQLTLQYIMSLGAHGAHRL